MIKGCTMEKMLRVPIAELNESGETHVHNMNGRVYSSFSNSYLGKMDDEDSAKNSILTRLNNGLSNGEYEFGKEIAQQMPQQKVVFFLLLGTP